MLLDVCLIRKVDFPTPLSRRKQLIVFSGPTGELGLSRTRITDLQDWIPLPLFLNDTEMPKPSFETFVEQHFLAQISLRTLMNRVNDTLRSWRMRPILSIFSSL